MKNNDHGSQFGFVASTERIKNLRNRILNAPMEVSAIRARIFTVSKEKYPGEPLAIQRSLAFRDTLAATPPIILEDELIVGRVTEKVRGAVVYPEVRAEWLLREFKAMDQRFTHRFNITREDAEELLEIAEKWAGETALDFTLQNLEPEVKEIRDRFIATDTAFNYGLHLFHPDMKRFLTLGFDTIIAQVKSELAASDSQDKAEFFRAVLITLEASQQWILSYAQEAKNQAIKTNGIQSDELAKVADVLFKIAHKPVSTFHEGLQLVFMLHLLLDFADGGHEIPYGRVDQLLYPLYELDLKVGRITEIAARELIESFFTQSSSISHFFENMIAYGIDGNTGRLNITLGGVNEEGEDVTNVLSFLFLDVANHLKTPQPNVSVRLHKGTPKAFFKRVMEVMSGGSNAIAVYNDEAIIASLTARGVSLQDAREYTVGGCVSFIPRGTYGPFCNAHVFLPKVFEAFLLKGRTFESYHEFHQALNDELSLVIKKLSRMLDTVDSIHKELLPQPFVSALVEGALERGADVKEQGGKYNFTGMNFAGFATIVDSLAAINHLVFETGEISFAELVNAVKLNYVGHEKTRQLILNKIPKFGSDDPQTNTIAKELWDFLVAETSRYQTYRGGTYIPGLINASTLHMLVGAVCGATPDGRLAKTPVSLGASPVNGVAVNGPTGVFNSISSIDMKKATAGIGLNMRFNPSAFQTKDQLKRFADLLKTYFFDMGGQHLQINVVDTETLKKAKTEPRQYADLMVRVAGYSAKFIELSPMTQDEIISRTEHK